MLSTHSPDIDRRKSQSPPICARNANWDMTVAADWFTNETDAFRSEQEFLIQSEEIYNNQITKSNESDRSSGFDSF
jgi:hypothetical protein